MLEWPQQIAAADSLIEYGKSVSASCFVSQVEIHPAFASHQIAIREASNKINYFSFNEWAVRPSQSITVMLIKGIDQMGLFSKLSSQRTASGTDYTLETYVSALEVIRARPYFFAHVAVEFRLFDTVSGALITRYDTSVQRLLAKNDLNLFAAAVSNIFAEELQNLAQRIPTDIGAHENP